MRVERFVGVFMKSDEVNMVRTFLAFIFVVMSVGIMDCRAEKVVVVDSATRVGLPNASLFDSNGKLLALSDRKGRLPAISIGSYPVTLRYLGFLEKVIQSEMPDTVFMQQDIAELPEVVVETKRHKVLHMLAYVREYSTLASYTDTVFLFREKMVDYMLVPDKNVKFKGWSNPRVLTSRSYYRMSNRMGLDSVSDESPYHFSWADWIGISSDRSFPIGLIDTKSGVDTVRGRYGAAEVWTKDKDKVNVSIDVLADAAVRKWVPNLSGFFQKDLEFERFRVNYDYENILGNTLSPINLTGYSFSIESNGRGHGMFRFNRRDEPFYVGTSAEVYILDKEYITIKEARKWANHKFDSDEIDIYEPMEVPPLEASVLELMDRVNNIDKEGILLELPPDKRLEGNPTGKNFKIGRRLLAMLKDFTGISAIKSRRNVKKRWDKFRQTQTLSNREHYNGE